VTTRIFPGRLNKGPLKITVPTVGDSREALKIKDVQHTKEMGTVY
jgi:hypothetical protein